jgi:HTH-type transcriptional regulator / antitoxin HigA
MNPNSLNPDKSSEVNFAEAYGHWQAMNQAGIKRPKTEAEYAVLQGVMDDLTSHYDIDAQPWSELFGLIARYMHEWELDNEPELKLMHLEPYERLKFMMERRGVSQVELDKAGVVAQRNLTNILSGKIGISKAVAKRLAGYFGVSVETFI